MSKPTLFYSNRCRYSMEYINKIKQVGLSNNINFVSIEENRGNLPPSVKRVPTIIMNNSVLSGRDAFEWLDSVNKQINTPKPQPASDRGVPKPVSRAAVAPEPREPEIMGIDGFNSTFSMIDNQEPSSYSQYESLDSISVREGDNLKLEAQSKSLDSSLPDKKSDMDSAYERLMEDRKQELTVK